MSYLGILFLFALVVVIGVVTMALGPLDERRRTRAARVLGWTALACALATFVTALLWVSPVLFCAAALIGGFGLALAAGGGRRVAAAAVGGGVLIAGAALVAAEHDAPRGHAPPEAAALRLAQRRGEDRFVLRVWSGDLGRDAAGCAAALTAAEADLAIDVGAGTDAERELIAAAAARRERPLLIVGAEGTGTLLRPRPWLLCAVHPGDPARAEAFERTLAAARPAQRYAILIAPRELGAEARERLMSAGSIDLLVEPSAEPGARIERVKGAYRATVGPAVDGRVSSLRIDADPFELVGVAEVDAAHPTGALGAEADAFVVRELFAARRRPLLALAFACVLSGLAALLLVPGLPARRADRDPPPAAVVPR